jgi:hypothetical protein
MTINEMVVEYNRLTGKNIKKFATKEIAIKKLMEARLAADKEKVVSKEKTYTPKQLETELGKDQLVIRRKLRKLYPTMAKQGAWKITLQMLDELRKVM